MRTLRFGDSGDDVRTVQRLLAEQGFFRGAVRGNFRALTREAVLYFQQTHLGPDGRPLGVDGIVGPNTWWALQNPSGAPQRSNLHPEIPEGLTPLRVRQLEIALGEHRAGVREIPDGCNGGDGVEKYLVGHRVPWCCYFWSWANRECFGRFSLGARYGACMSAWKKAETLGMARPKEDGHLPIPGDAFVMLYRGADGRFNGRGHIGFVLRVGEPTGDGLPSINTVEGNCGNRVKVGRRDLDSRQVIGFINNFPDEEQPDRWERGLTTATAVDSERTR